MPTVRDLAKALLPPVVSRAIASVLYPRSVEAGPFDTFAEARAACPNEESYANPDLVANAVRRMKLAQSRDTRDVDRQTQQLLAAMSPALAANRSGVLNVVDFGGGPGGHYHAGRLVLPIDLRWFVVEVMAMVAAMSGAQAINGLEFVSSIPEDRFDFALASGSLQYLDRPRETLRQLCYRAPWVCVTRCPLVNTPEHQTIVQRIPAKLGGHPLAPWRFSRSRREEELAAHSQIVMRWAVRDRRPVKAWL